MDRQLQQIIERFIASAERAGTGVLLSTLPAGACAQPRCPLCGCAAVNALHAAGGAVLVSYRCRNTVCANRGKMVTQVVREAGEGGSANCKL